MIDTRSKRIRVERRGEGGFALLEILIAFVVLALGLGAIATGITVAMRSDARTEVHRGALRVAQARLEVAGITETLVQGYREGLIANKFRWRQTVTEIGDTADLPRQQGAQSVPPNGQLRSFWVEISVEAPDGTAARLAALKLATRVTP